MKHNFMIPFIAAPYRNVYSPQGDFYLGIDTASFRNGQFYQNWITNDFTIIQNRDGYWHAFGITHPMPPDYIDDYDFGKDVHEAEYQLFHCSYKGHLSSLYADGIFFEHEKVLYPQEREGMPECWAPCMIEKDDVYHIFWSPKEIRHTTTNDLYHFDKHSDILFSGPYYMRDPYIIKEGSMYYMIYFHDSLYVRTSKNLVDWSSEKVFQPNPWSMKWPQESPCIIKRLGHYYLFWSSYDVHTGCYDNHTFVFVSDTLDGFHSKAPITMLPGHAVEIVSDQDCDYIISVYYPENGLNIAPLDWKQESWPKFDNK